MNKAHARPVRDLRNNYNELSALVKNNDHIIITNNGREDSVLININEYREFEEFQHIKYVKQSLAKAKAQSENASTDWYSLDDLRSYIDNV